MLPRMTYGLDMSHTEVFLASQRSIEAKEEKVPVLVPLTV